MFVFLARALGFWLIAAGIVGIVIDGTKSIAADRLIITPLGQAWFELSPNSLNGLQAGIERNIHPFLWDPVMLWLLMLPNWAAIGGLGFLLVWLTTPRTKAADKLPV